MEHQLFSDFSIVEIEKKKKKDNILKIHYQSLELYLYS